jgi:hypothetical protein
MSWPETISSVLGTATTGATVAVAIYTGSIWLENEMRSEAKMDIARLINNSEINPDSRTTSNFVLHAFETMFGSTHWSVKCLARSVIASCAFLLIISAFIFSKYSPYFLSLEFIRWFVFRSMNYNVPESVWLLGAVIIAGFLPDYISLYKGRKILKRMTSDPTILKMGYWVLVNIVASVLLSLVFSIVTFTILAMYSSMPTQPLVLSI